MYIYYNNILVMAILQDTKDVNTLIGFVNDNKPYHSKLKEVSIHYNFNDDINVKIKDDLHTNIEVGGVWGGFRWNTQYRPKVIISDTTPINQNLNTTWIQPIYDPLLENIKESKSSCLLSKAQEYSLYAPYDIPPLDLYDYESSTGNIIDYKDLPYTDVNENIFSFYDYQYTLIGIIRNYVGKKNISENLIDVYTLTFEYDIDYVLPKNNIKIIIRNKVGKIIDNSLYKVNISYTKDDNIKLLISLSFNNLFTGKMELEYDNWEFEDYCILSSQEPLEYNNDVYRFYNCKWFDVRQHEFKIWKDYNTIGKERFNFISDGSIKYKTYRLPAYEFPKFSSNQHKYTLLGVTDHIKTVHLPRIQSHIYNDPIKIDKIEDFVLYKGVANFEYIFEKNVGEQIKTLYCNLVNGTDYYIYNRIKVIQDDNYPNAASTWQLSHNLYSYNISVIIYDKNGKIVDSKIEAQSDTQCSIKLPYPLYEGKAIIIKQHELSENENIHSIFYHDGTKKINVKEKYIVQLFDNKNNSIPNFEINNNIISFDNLFHGMVRYCKPDNIVKIKPKKSKITIPNNYGNDLIIQVFSNKNLIKPLLISINSTDIIIELDNYNDKCEVYIKVGKAFNISKNCIHNLNSYELCYALYDDDNNSILHNSISIIDNNKIYSEYSFGKIVLYTSHTKNIFNNNNIAGFTRNKNKLQVNDCEFYFLYNEVDNSYSYPFSSDIWSQYKDYISSNNYIDFITWTKEYTYINTDFFINMLIPSKLIDFFIINLRYFLYNDINSYMATPNNIQNCINILTNVENNLLKSLDEIIVKFNKLLLDTTLYNKNLGIHLSEIDKKDIIKKIYELRVNIGVKDVFSFISMVDKFCSLYFHIDKLSFSDFFNDNISIDLYSVCAEYRYNFWLMLENTINNILPIKSGEIYNFLTNLKFIIRDSTDNKEIAKSLIPYITSDFKYDKCKAFLNTSLKKDIIEKIEIALQEINNIPLSILNVEYNKYSSIFPIKKNVYSIIANYEYKVMMNYALEVIHKSYAYIEQLGAYYIPYNNGCYVKVNGREKIVGEDFIITNEMRNTLQFLGDIPNKDDIIEVDCFFIDRFFISIVTPDDKEHPAQCGNGEKWLSYIIRETKNGWDNIEYDLIQWDLGEFNINENYTIFPKVKGQSDQYVSFGDIGVIKRIKSNTGDYYELELFNIPPRDSIVSIRVDHNGNTGRFMKVGIEDNLIIKNCIRFFETINISTTEQFKHHPISYFEDKIKTNIKDSTNINIRKINNENVSVKVLESELQTSNETENKLNPSQNVSISISDSLKVIIIDKGKK